MFLKLFVKRGCIISKQILLHNSNYIILFKFKGVFPLFFRNFAFAKPLFLREVYLSLKH